MRHFWHHFERPPLGGGLDVRIWEEEGHEWLQLPGDPPLQFDDPWTLAEVLRYWLVEHAVQRAQTTLPFHAASLTREDTAVLFAGASGAGKTTLSVELAAAGWALGGDDIAPIDLASGRVHPFPKPLSVRRRELWDGLPPPPRGWSPPPAKGPRLVPADAFARVTEPFSVTNLLFIAYEPDESPSTEGLSPGQATALCVEYARAGGPPAISTLARLCRSAPAARIRYPTTSAAVTLIEDLVAKTEN